MLCNDKGVSQHTVVQGVVLPISSGVPGAPPRGQVPSANFLPPTPLDDQYRTYNTYSVVRLLDALITLGSVGLCICYIIARHYHHVGVFCFISDLVVNLPERILFRLDFSIVGCALLLLAFPVRDYVARKVDRTLPTIAAYFQMFSGVGVILVAACGPHEVISLHLSAAILGFAGSGIAQIMYGVALVQEDQPTPKARILFVLRCCISVAFLTSAAIVGLGAGGVIPGPAQPIGEWGMWIFLLLWYHTFRFDMMEPGESFDIATVNKVSRACHRLPVEGFVL